MVPSDRRIFSGVMGCENTCAFRGGRASLIAFMTAAGTPAVPELHVVQGGPDTLPVRVNESFSVQFHGMLTISCPRARWALLGVNRLVAVDQSLNNHMHG